MSETNLHHWLSDHARKRRAHVQRIEDRYSTGVPDINLCAYGKEHWVECKYLKAWPKRAGTKVKIKFRPGQVNWLRSRGKAGGNAWVLLQVGDGRNAERLLFSWKVADQLEDAVLNTEDTRALALVEGEDAVWWLTHK